MAPVRKNIARILVHSKSSKALHPVSEDVKIKDEPPDENSIYQEEQMDVWDSSIVKEEDDDGIKCGGQAVCFKTQNAVSIETDGNGLNVEKAQSKSLIRNSMQGVETFIEVKKSEDVSMKSSLDNNGSGDSELSSNESEGNLVIVENEKPDLENNDRNEVKQASSGHSCLECGKSFPQASKLTLHMKIHNGDKPFRCPECGKYFALQQHLNWHSRIHTEGSYYCCPVCKRKFTEQTNLGRHLLKTHPDEKPYKCSECGKQFVQASALKRHLKVHNTAHAVEEIGRVDSMFLIEESNPKAMEEIQKGRKSSKHSEEKFSHVKDQHSSRDSKNKANLKEGEVENNLPKFYQSEKQVKKSQVKSKFQKKQLSAIGAKLKQIKNFITSEEQKGRPVLGAQIRNGPTDNFGEFSVYGKDRKSLSPEKLPLKVKGNRSNVERMSLSDEEIDESPNHGRFGKHSLQDLLGETSFSCRNCGEKFRSKPSLYNHVMCHIGMKLHDCSMCGKHFSETLSLERHYIYHITGSFPQECLRCGRHFFSYHDLKDHSQTHLSDKRAFRPSDQFKCNKCRRNFPSFRVLESHLRSLCHEDRRPGKARSGSSKPKTTRDSSDSMVVDVDPRLAFPAVGDISDTISGEDWNSGKYGVRTDKSLSTLGSAFEGEEVEAAQLMQDLSQSRRAYPRVSPDSDAVEEHSSLGVLDCAECGKQIAGIEAMMQHIKEHVTAKANLKCPVVRCGKMFKDSGDFQAHIRAHGGEKPYSCSHCGKAFFLRENYEKHVKRHETWGSYATIIGGNTVAESYKSSDVNYHMVEAASLEGNSGGNKVQWTPHTTNRPVCDRKEFQLNPMMAGKQPVDVGKAKTFTPLACGESMQPTILTSKQQNTANAAVGNQSEHTQQERMCANALVQLFRVSDSINAINASNNVLRRYPRSGQCEVCFKFCSRLDKHMMVHLGQKPHLCPICPQAFRQSEHLKRHIRARHEGNHRIFECHLCLKRLTRKDKLKEHMRNCRKALAQRQASTLSDRLFELIPGPSR